MHPSFAVHLRDEAAECARVGGGERAELFAESRLADGANLVDGDLGAPFRDAHFDASAPRGVELACEGADGDGLESLVQDVEAHDDDGPRLGHFGTLRRGELCPADFVALHFFAGRLVLTG